MVLSLPGAAASAGRSKFWMIETTDDGVASNNDTKEGSTIGGVGGKSGTVNDFSSLSDGYNCICDAVAGGIECGNFDGCCGDSPI